MVDLTVSLMIAALVDLSGIQYPLVVMDLNLFGCVIAVAVPPR